MLEKRIKFKHQESLIQIENNIIKYAKVSKEQDNGVF